MEGKMDNPGMDRLIVSVKDLARYMKVGRERVFRLIKAKRIVPDYRDSDKHLYFSVTHAAELIKKHVAQRGQPRRSKRTYDR